MNVSAVSVCALNAAPYYHNKFFFFEYFAQLRLSLD